MKITLLALAAVAILAQLAQAKESKVIPECLQTFKVPAKGYAEGGCCLLAKQYGVTFQDLLDWNTGLRKDCLNLDVGNYICVKAPKKAPATDAQGNPVPPAKCTLTMSPQTATTNPATKNNKPKPEVIATGPDMPKAQTKATRPLYPNTVPPKAALQQPPKPMAQGPKAVQQPPKPMTQGPKAAQQQPPKPMAQGPKAVQQPPKPMAQGPEAVQQPPKPMAQGPKAAQQQPPKPMAQGPKAVQQPPKPMTQNPKAAQQQPPKPMTQGPKAESVW